MEPRFPQNGLWQSALGYNLELYLELSVFFTYLILFAVTAFSTLRAHVIPTSMILETRPCTSNLYVYDVPEESAFRVLSNNKDNQPDIAGIPIILKAYSIHKDNAEVVENICILLMELLEYGECS